MKKNKKKTSYGLARKTIIMMLWLIIICCAFVPLLNNLKFGLDLKGGFEVLYQVKSIDGKEVTEDMVVSTYKTMEKRIDVLGVTEPNIVLEGKDKIRVQLAGINNPEEARTILSQAANLTFRDTNDNLLMGSDVLKSGGAKVGVDNTGLPAVALSIADKDKFYKVTKKVSEMEDNRLVIWLDFEAGVNSFNVEEHNCGSLSSSKCLSVASVPQGFASDVIIQGNFTTEEVQSLVELINSGSLPTQLEEISSKTVGASFGEDSLQKTFTAGLVGIALIILFMISTYRFAGFIASIGIMIYTFITIFTFWLVGGVLTLPGIAALVIGIGMAIDACVISFSRIKDELLEGTKFQMAVKNGNKNSFWTIFDSNITTLLVAIILFIFGESAIKGFATMLIISTIVTMLIMVALTRWLIRLFAKTGYFDNKPSVFLGIREKNIPNVEKGEKRKYYAFQKIDFVKNRKWFYLGSIIVIAVGTASLVTNGLNLGVDFKGGTSIGIRTEQKITEKQIKEDLKELKFDLRDIETGKDGTITATINNELDNNEVLDTEDYFEEKYEAKTEIGVISNVVKIELINNAIKALLIAFIGIVIYVSIRFKFSYAITGIIALLHDVIMIIALFSILKLEVSSIFIAAILSIIGYSINDTIVTFDRIRENINKNFSDRIMSKNELKEVVNNSLRSTLVRSIITTITTLIPVGALIFLGSGEILNFNLALLFGLISGVYSSLFIASQLWYDIEQRHHGKRSKKKKTKTEPEELAIKGINS